MKYDYLIVGAGMFGAVFARQLTDAGAKCLVIEQRNHIGGNCFTRNENGIHVHQYGAHIFHTNNQKIWKYINRWAEFNHYKHHIKVNHRNSIYSFPINLFTLHQMWGVTTPEKAQKKLNEVKVRIDNPKNLEEWILSQVGEELYQTFIYGYTKKNWGCEPRELPSGIIKRLPIRLTYNDNYFNDTYQGIPIGGYTQIFEKLLEGIPIEFGTNYLSNREELNLMAKKVVYTGALDEFFEYDLGVLDWRSLKFEEEQHTGDYQGVSIMNYTEEQIPYTRIIEHKHFETNNHDHSIITKEYPQEWSRDKLKIYPINTQKNNNLYNEYACRIDPDKYIIGGRLAEYKYYDMHQVIGSSLKKSIKEFT